MLVSILENGRHLGFLIGPSGRIDLVTIEMPYANFGARITICTIHPKNACYLLHYKGFWEKEQRRPKTRWMDNINGDMTKFQLTEDMAQDRKHWMTKIMAGPAQADGHSRKV